jgi:hypothetical protein
MQSVAWKNASFCAEMGSKPQLSRLEITRFIHFVAHHLSVGAKPGKSACSKSLLYFISIRKI